MKRSYLVLIAIVMAAVFVFAGCGGKDAGKDKNGKTEQTAAPTPQIADGTGFDNSVEIVDGSVKGTAFNWQFFLGKSGAGRQAEIKIISKNGNSSEEMTLSGGKGSFTLKRGSDEKTYTYLLSFTADFPTSTKYSMAEICVLTDNADLSAEQFFGGSVPENARVGNTNANGVVVFTNYKAK